MVEEWSHFMFPMILILEMSEHSANTCFNEVYRGETIGQTVVKLRIIPIA